MNKTAILFLVGALTITPGLMLIGATLLLMFGADIRPDAPDIITQGGFVSCMIALGLMFYGFYKDLRG